CASRAVRYGRLRPAARNDADARGVHHCARVSRYIFAVGAAARRSACAFRRGDQFGERIAERVVVVFYRLYGYAADCWLPVAQFLKAPVPLAARRPAVLPNAEDGPCYVAADGRFERLVEVGTLKEARPIAA